MENKPEKKLWMGWVASLLFSLACVGTMIFIYTVSEMFKLEFSRCEDDMRSTILAIKPNDPVASYSILKMNTLADYGFIIGYSMLTLFSLKLLLNGLELKNNSWWVYAIAFATGFWDSIENIYLLKSSIQQQACFSSLFFWSVRIKWGFSIIVFLLVPFISIYGFILSTRSKQEN